MFDFKCFSVEDTHDPSVGLLHGDLSIPGFLLRREIFDPVVDQVMYLLLFFPSSLYYEYLYVSQ